MAWGYVGGVEKAKERGTTKAEAKAKCMTLRACLKTNISIKTD